jgi:subtilisin family serine protease
MLRLSSATLIRPLIILLLCFSFIFAEHVPNQIIIQQRTPLSTMSNASINRKLSGTLSEKLKRYGAFQSTFLAENAEQTSGLTTQATRGPTGTAYHLITFTASQNIDNIMAELQKDPEILSVQPNFVYKLMAIPNDPLTTPNQTYLNQISAFAGWDLCTGNSGVVVAILDSGATIAHEDLITRITSNYKNIVSNNNDVSDIATISAYTAYGHGTLVAGIIGATASNNLGIAGIDWNCQLLIVRVFNDQMKSDTAYLVTGINYAMEHGANVINMSLGGAEYDPALDRTCKAAWDNGLILVAAMGNTDKDTPQNAIIYPAGFTTVIGVGSVNKNNDLSTYSCYGHGSQTTDVVAPGEFIMSTAAIPGTNNYTDLFSGTSFSTPMVSGLAALMKAQYPTLSNANIRNIIENSCDPLGSGYDILKYGHGIINIKNALERASGYVTAKSITEIMNYPNPVIDGQTKFSFQSKKAIQSAEFVIYDLRGREVAKVTSGGTPMNTGGTYKTKAWDCTDSHGNALPNGTYIYTVKATDVDGGTQHGRGKLAIVR